jgi:hypothetical protein
MCNLGVNNGIQYAYKLIERCMLNALKPEIHADNIYKFSSCRLKTHHHSNNQPVNTVREKKIAVCCENHAEHINTLCGQNAVFFNVKACGTYSYHCIKAVIGLSHPTFLPCGTRFTVCCRR